MNSFNISKGIAMPANVSKGGAAERYPFDKLGAPKAVKDDKGKTVKDENGATVYEYESFPTNRTAKQMASTVYSASRRYSTEKTDDKGAVVLNAKGKPELTFERKFKCFDVDPTTDPDGAVSRVWRIL